MREFGGTCFPTYGRFASVSSMSRLKSRQTSRRVTVSKLGVVRGGHSDCHVSAEQCTQGSLQPHGSKRSHRGHSGVKRRPATTSLVRPRSSLGASHACHADLTTNSHMLPQATWQAIVWIETWPQHTSPAWVHCAVFFLNAPQSSRTVP